MLIMETDKSLNKGPVIKKKGINKNKIVGITKKTNFFLLNEKSFKLNNIIIMDI